MVRELRIAEQNVQQLLDIVEGKVSQNGQSFLFDQDNLLLHAFLFISVMEEKMPLNVPYEDPKWTSKDWFLASYVRFLYRLLYVFRKMPEEIRSLLVLELDFYNPTKYRLWIPRSRWNWVFTSSEFEDIKTLTEKDLVGCGCFSLIQETPNDFSSAYMLRLEL